MFKNKLSSQLPRKRKIKLKNKITKSNIHTFKKKEKTITTTTKSILAHKK